MIRITNTERRVIVRKRMEMSMTKLRGVQMGTELKMTKLMTLIPRSRKSVGMIR